MTQPRYTVETCSTGHSVVWDNHRQQVVETEYWRGPRGLSAICQSLNEGWKAIKLLQAVIEEKRNAHPCA